MLQNHLKEHAFKNLENYIISAMQESHCNGSSYVSKRNCLQFRSIYVHTFQFLTLVPEDRETFEIILLKASLYMFESMHNEFD